MMKHVALSDPQSGPTTIRTAEGMMSVLDEGAARVKELADDYRFGGIASFAKRKRMQKLLDEHEAGHLLPAESSEISPSQLQEREKEREKKKKKLEKDEEQEKAALLRDKEKPLKKQKVWFSSSGLRSDVAPRIALSENKRHLPDADIIVLQDLTEDKQNNLTAWMTAMLQGRRVCEPAFLQNAQGPSIKYSDRTELKRGIFISEKFREDHPHTAQQLTSLCTVLSQACTPVVLNSWKAGFRKFNYYI